VVGVGCASGGSRRALGRGGCSRDIRGVGPLAQQGLDEGFGFAIGLRSPWACVAPLDAELGAGVAPGEGAVAVAVIREHAFDVDALSCVPAEGSTKESDAVVGAFAR
jgi:hypothetical protein